MMLSYMRNLAVASVLLYLRFFARLALSLHKPKVIGITGSVGKSSARNAIYTILKDEGNTKVIEHGNSETGVPLGILGLVPQDYSPFDWLMLIIKSPLKIGYLKKTEYLVIEMGIDAPDPPKNMGYLLTIVKPDIAIFLNAFGGAVHSMQFEKLLPSDSKMSDEEKRDFLGHKIAEEKARIITESNCAIGIYNNDNTFVTQALVKMKNTNTRLFTFGKSKNSTIVYKNYEISLEGTTFQYESKYGSTVEKITLDLKYLLPEAYGETLAAAVLTGLAVGLTAEQIKSSLEKNFHIPAGRASIFTGIKDTIIIDSSYNASKAAVSAFLEMVGKLKDLTRRPVVFVFGDMRELGELSKIEHEDVANQLVKVVDQLICVGMQTKKYVIPIAKNNLDKVEWFERSTEAGLYIEDHLPEKAIILFKGSQNTIFLEEAIKPLLKNSEDIHNLCRQSDFWMKKKGLNNNSS